MRTAPASRPVLAAACVIALGAAFLLPACATVSTQPSPVPIKRSAVPFGLLDPNRVLPGAAQDNGMNTQADVVIFLLGPTGKLYPSVRRLAGSHSLDDVLAALQAGPTAAETAGGVTSAIPQSTGALTSRTLGNVATVQLTNAFDTLTGSSEIEAVAQIVYTATAVPGVRSVAFTLGGKAVDVPDQSGVLLAPPVTRSDYAFLAPS